MPKKRYNAEEIIHRLREADVLLSQGRTVSQAPFGPHSRLDRIVGCRSLPKRSLLFL